VTTAGSVERQADRVLLILLDVSGSMKESVRGGVKSDLAVRGLLSTLESLPANAVVGLRLMGEGPGDAECEATRTAVEIGPFFRPPWNAALDAVRWNGATPLVYSMRAALDNLRRTHATRRDLLIIGDGDETCGDDPVGVARAEAGDIRIHGISLGEETSHQLAGIALVTGGTYTRAFDDTSFAEAAGVLMPAAPSAPVGPVGPGAGGARPGQVEIILDVSNSMWGQVNGRAKIELAREALAGALAGFSADIPIGLRAYGHRVNVENKEAGCEDTERLLAPAPDNGSAIINLANGLTPRGQTPIARSLREAGADLGREGGAGVIVLVSDGVESCGGDPEAAARELRASGVEVVLHTVGLGVGAVDAAALAALATAGGGQYFDASDAADLVQGVRGALQSSTAFVLERDSVAGFPTPITRVSGGAAVADAEVLEPGYFSFTDHLFRELRYFAVRGQPGSSVTVRGMVCALEIGRTRAGAVTFQGSPNMMFVERVDAAGERLRGQSLIVRGDMGTWVDFPVEVGADGVARFRIGRPQGAVHRDMVFSVVR
jgi:Mg-chelatase subunit ChlD